MHPCAQGWHNCEETSRNVRFVCPSLSSVDITLAHCRIFLQGCGGGLATFDEKAFEDSFHAILRDGALKAGLSIRLPGGNSILSM